MVRGGSRRATNWGRNIRAFRKERRPGLGNRPHVSKNPPRGGGLGRNKSCLPAQRSSILQQFASLAARTHTQTRYAFATGQTIVSLRSGPMKSVFGGSVALVTLIVSASVSAAAIVLVRSTYDLYIRGEVSGN